MMRIITGKAKGIRLNTLEGNTTRPTAERVKEAIFSMIQFDLEGRRVLDLFAGSGALGIEALSRGASHCIFSDKSQKSVSIVKTNVTKARLTDKAEIVKADYKEVLSDCTGKDKKFDIIFLDPPYAKGLLDEALQIIHSNSLLTETGVVVAEFDNGTPLDIQNYTLIKDKRYGRVCIYILEAQ